MDLSAYQLTLRTYPVSELEGVAIAIDATYYINSWLYHVPHHQPLVPALAGSMSIEKDIEADLDQFKAHGVVPFFIFDGQPITGQDEVSVTRGQEANKRTDDAWEKYLNNAADNAVKIFGDNPGMLGLLLHSY